MHLKDGYGCYSSTWKRAYASIDDKMDFFDGAGCVTRYLNYRNKNSSCDLFQRFKEMPEQPERAVVKKVKHHMKSMFIYNMLCNYKICERYFS